MTVFASQFSRARPYAVAYAGPAGDSRFWTPATVTAASVAAAFVLAAALDEAPADATADGAGGGFDPGTLDDAGLELPGLSAGGDLPGAVAVPAGAQSGAAAGGETGGEAGLHTVSAAGSAADITPEQAALLDDGSATAWSHHSDLTDTAVGGDGSGFSYINTGDSGVTIGPDGGVIY